MPTDVLPGTLVIFDTRKLIGESLRLVFTMANAFSGVCAVSDRSSPIVTMRACGPTVFLIVVHSYLRARQTVHDIRSSQPDATIVILDEQFRSGGGLLLRDTVAHGYWTFHDSVEGIVDGIHRASRRYPSISPYAANHLRHHRRKGLQIGPGLLEHPIYKLSRRERELFHLIAAGKKIETCAEEMSIVKKTACNLRERLMKKFNVKSGTDLVWKAIEVGLVDPLEPVPSHS